MHSEDRTSDPPGDDASSTTGTALTPSTISMTPQRYSARHKTLLAGTTLLAILATPIQRWEIFVVFAVGLAAIYAISRVNLRDQTAGLARAIPFLFLLALGVPISRGFSTGWDIAVGVLAKAVLSLAVVRLVVATTPVSEIFEALLFFRFPRLLVAVLSLLVRYRFLFAEELHRLRRAKDSRTFCLSRIREWRILPNLIGIVFVRALGRAERVHEAMLARGWTGEYHSLREPAIPPAASNERARLSRGAGSTP
ncbi:MAG: CbiQ family ECF transporter T component [Planctomycetota bacterium]